MIYNRTRTSETIRGVPYIVSKLHKLWPTNGLKWNRHFYPPFENCAFYSIARIRTRRSTNGTQPNFARCSEVKHICRCMSKIWGFTSQNRKIGELKTTYFVTVLILTELCQMTKIRAGVFIHLP